MCSYIIGKFDPISYCDQGFTACVLTLVVSLANNIRNLLSTGWCETFAVKVRKSSERTHRCSCAICASRVQMPRTRSLTECRAKDCPDNMCLHA